MPKRDTFCHIWSLCQDPVYDIAETTCDCPCVDCDHKEGMCPSDPRFYLKIWRILGEYLFCSWFNHNMSLTKGLEVGVAGAVGENAARLAPAESGKEPGDLFNIATADFHQWYHNCDQGVHSSKGGRWRSGALWALQGGEQPTRVLQWCERQHDSSRMIMDCFSTFVRSGASGSRGHLARAAAGRGRGRGRGAATPQTSNKPLTGQRQHFLLKRSKKRLGVV